MIGPAPAPTTTSGTTAGHRDDRIPGRTDRRAARDRRARTESRRTQSTTHVALRFVVLHQQLLLAQVLAARLAKVPGFVCVAATDVAATALSQPGVDVLLVDHRLAATGLAWQGGDDPSARPALALLGHDTEPDQVAVVEAALRAGARAWIPADTELMDLATALQQVAAGQVWVPPGQMLDVIDRLATVRAQHDETPLLPLTARESEVLLRLASGYTSAEIASALFVTINTVRTHRRQILLKLGVHSAREASAIARNAGMQLLDRTRTTP